MQEIIEIPKYCSFDKQGNYILDDEYLFAYKHFDGLTERLLSIELVLDKLYNFTIYYNMFRVNALENTTSIAYSGIRDDMPDEILGYLSEISSKGLTGISDKYMPEVNIVDDIPSQTYIFKFGEKTRSVWLNGLIPLTLEYFPTAEETRFLAFHRFIKEWTFKLVKSNDAKGVT